MLIKKFSVDGTFSTVTNRLPWIYFGRYIKTQARNRLGLFEKCPAEFCGGKLFKIDNNSQFKSKKIYDENSFRSMFCREPDHTFLDQPISSVFNTVPVSMKYDISLAKLEYQLSVMDGKFLPKKLAHTDATAEAKQYISYINRSVCPRSNSSMTNDVCGEDIKFDLDYNIGENQSAELVSALENLCAGKYCRTKGQKDFDCLRDDVKWKSFLESSTFEYLVMLQSCTDYAYKEIRYAKTLIPNEEISEDLKFLLCLGNNEDYEDKNFEIRKDTKLLAEALQRLAHLARFSESKLISFGMLCYMRKFVSDFVDYERNKIRKILSFTTSEAHLVFRLREDLNPSEEEARRILLDNHRNLRVQAINSHR